MMIVYITTRKSHTWTAIKCPQENFLWILFSTNQDVCITWAYNRAPFTTLRSRGRRNAGVKKSSRCWLLFQFVNDRSKSTIKQTIITKYMKSIRFLVHALKCLKTVGVSLMHATGVNLASSRSQTSFFSDMRWHLCRRSLSIQTGPKWSDEC